MQDGNVLAVIIRVVAKFVSNPRWMITGALVLLVVGISLHAKDVLLLPIAAALALWALILYTRGQ